MVLTIGFAFSLGVLFPVFMEEFDESRERTGKINLDIQFCKRKRRQLVGDA